MKSSLLLFACASALLLFTGCQSLTGQHREPHSISITRTFHDAMEQKLIARAEQAPPTEAAIQRVAAAGGKSVTVAGLREKWWTDTFDGVRILWYVSPDALPYYEQMIRKFRRGDFRDTRGIEMISSTLTYSALVIRHDTLELSGKTYPKGYLVTIDLSWSQYCGPVCAASFAAQRKVVFDEAGEILTILGDDDERFMLISSRDVSRSSVAD